MLFEYYWYKQVYTPEECDEIYQKALANKISRDNDLPGENKNVDCFGISTVDFEKDLDKFFRRIYYANNHSFGFDLYDLYMLDTCNVNVYGKGKSYGCHRDATDLGSFSDIKLTAILNISTEKYTGGDFLLHFGTRKCLVTEIANPGDILIFPSFWYHEVTPVTSGNRISLSAWMKGPNWR